MVEILSPGTKSRDRHLKRDVYERTGVEEYWVVDPDQNVVDVYAQQDPTSARGRTFSAPIRHERTQSLTAIILRGCVPREIVETR